MPFLLPDDMRQREPRPGWRGRFFDSAHMSFADYTIEAGSWIHEHHHPNEEVWIVLEGELEVTVGSETRKAGPGCVAIVPPDVPHSVRALTSGRALIADYPLRTGF